MTCSTSSHQGPVWSSAVDITRFVQNPVNDPVSSPQVKVAIEKFTRSNNKLKKLTFTKCISCSNIDHLLERVQVSRGATHAPIADTWQEHVLQQPCFKSTRWVEYTADVSIKVTNTKIRIIPPSRTSKILRSKAMKWATIATFVLFSFQFH